MVCVTSLEAVLRDASLLAALRVAVGALEDIRGGCEQPRWVALDALRRVELVPEAASLLRRLRDEREKSCGG